MSNVIPHRLSMRSKAEATVGNEFHKRPSLFKVFPRTLSIFLCSVCDKINYGEIDDNDETLEKFILFPAINEYIYDLV